MLGGPGGAQHNCARIMRSVARAIGGSVNVTPPSAAPLGPERSRSSALPWGVGTLTIGRF